MTKTINTLAANAFADALNVEARKLSDTNKKRASALAMLARTERVATFLEACNVSVDIVSDLYLTEKVLKCADALSQDTITSADFNENTFCALKTVLLNAERELFASDLLKAAISNNFKVSEADSAFCYRRASLISATRQEQLNVKMCEVMNIVGRVNKTQVKTNADSHALVTAQQKLATAQI